MVHKLWGLFYVSVSNPRVSKPIIGILLLLCSARRTAKKAGKTLSADWLVADKALSDWWLTIRSRCWSRDASNVYSGAVQRHVVAEIDSSPLSG